MKGFLLLSISILLIQCVKPWYRKLPEREDTFSNQFAGTWTKRANPRSAMNSTWHKNKWKEKIVLHKDLSFVKTYESEDLVGESVTNKRVIGKGIYTIQKNWILLQTKSLELLEIQNGKAKKTTARAIEHDLLYYYYLDGNFIIPMIYDMGYEDADFGVKDGISKPFDESNPNFFRYIKIYAFKEFQSHAYYPEN